MKKLLVLSLPLILAACASQSPALQDVEGPVSAEQQRAAQQAVSEPTRLALKRKLAVGRLSNETTYGRSLIGTNASDSIGQKITDMFVQSLINSNNYLVFERPDIALLERESELSGQSVNIIGVDTLVIGSLTEFGRSTTGESGFLSSSKRQEATATIDLRLVDTRTGQVTESVTGTGSSSTETASTMGFGSVASYDGSLNDQAIGAAVNAAVEKLTLLMLEKPWSADVLAVEDGLIYISGGASQGIHPGMVFDVMTRGRQVTSQTTGGIITLPGNKVGELRIDGTFGDSELEEGAYGGLVSGSIAGQPLEQLIVREAN
ncbi:CsgG/HfaB family protein [Saccharospirillum mangrovi]|uniref:CsgG/HfaB family protein n=1 Tax=Saccharospirillum mangrovi TaxID=2161747 RepID=UPI000D3AF72E|nr:CsgG/HfaB family protein [Saccharospirillum mangrovi]